MKVIFVGKFLIKKTITIMCHINAEKAESAITITVIKLQAVMHHTRHFYAKLLLNKIFNHDRNETVQIILLLVILCFFVDCNGLDAMKVNKKNRISGCRPAVFLAN